MNSHDLQTTDRKQTQAKKTTFRPHQRTDLDVPAFHILLEPMLPLIRPIMAVIYAVRWQLARPLQIRVLPKWVPYIDFPGLHSLNLLTLGEILLAIPLVILILAGYYLTFISPAVEQSGEIAKYAIFATFLTVNKTNSIAAFLFGISFERMIPFHNMSSLCAVILSFFHGYVAFAYGDAGSGDGGLFSAAGGSGFGGGGSSSSDDRRFLSSDDSQYGLTGPNPNVVKFAFDGSTNMSGSLLALSMIGLVASSLFPILRRKFFDFWFWTHIGLAICVIIFCLLHEVATIMFIAIWWIFDVLMRYVVMAGCRYPRKATLTKVLPDVVEISFPKPDGFEYNAGQFVQISVQDLGVMSFHPISISSSPHEPIVTLHVRALGKWSKALVDLANTKEEVKIYVEGPYGCLSVDLDDDRRYQMAVCVSGGIGVTLCQSVAKSLLNDHQGGRTLKQLRFVWAIRDLNMLHLMAPLEVSSSSTSADIELAQMSSPSDQTQRHDESFPHDHHGVQSDIIKTDIFVTKSSDKLPEAHNLNDNPRHIHFGRPNIDAILREVAEDAERQGVTHVAVFGCGPKALMQSLQEACRVQSKGLTECGGVTFDVHEEIFEF